MDDVGADRKSSDFDEIDIDRYVRRLRKRPRAEQKQGDPISEVRRKEVRAYVCLFMESATRGAFDRKAVKTIKEKDIRREWGSIVWLERGEAENLVGEIYNRVGEYWGDLTRLQLDMGWRAEELLILQKRFVSNEVIQLESVVTASGAMLGKTGGRSVRIPRTSRDAIQRRMEADGDLLFPHMGRNHRRKKQEFPLSGMWSPDWFNRRYRVILTASAKNVGIIKPMGCRILRRTFGSLQLRADKSPYQVSVLMGNSEKIVREHYAALFAEEIDIDLN